MATSQNQASEQPAVRCMTWLGEWADVPQDIAKCPECGAQLKAWVDGWSEGRGYTLMLDCSEDEISTTHQCCQCDWQPVMDVVEAWANSPSVGSEPLRASQRHSQHRTKQEENDDNRRSE